MLIYHITEQSTWDQAIRDGIYLPTNFMREGFIHCSTRDQILNTAERYYAHDRNLVILQIDVARLQSDVVEENLFGGTEYFPHIYGPLNLDAVVSAAIFNKGEDEKFHFPFL